MAKVPETKSKTWLLNVSPLLNKMPNHLAPMGQAKVCETSSASTGLHPGLAAERKGLEERRVSLELSVEGSACPLPQTKGEGIPGGCLDFQNWESPKGFPTPENPKGKFTESCPVAEREQGKRAVLGVLCWRWPKKQAFTKGNGEGVEGEKCLPSRRQDKTG